MDNVVSIAAKDSACGKCLKVTALHARAA